MVCGVPQEGCCWSETTVDQAKEKRPLYFKDFAEKNFEIETKISSLGRTQNKTPVQSSCLLENSTQTYQTERTAYSNKSQATTMQTLSEKTC